MTTSYYGSHGMLLTHSSPGSGCFLLSCRVFGLAFTTWRPRLVATYHQQPSTIRVEATTEASNPPAWMLSVCSSGGPRFCAWPTPHVQPACLLYICMACRILNFVESASSPASVVVFLGSNSTYSSRYHSSRPLRSILQYYLLSMMHTITPKNKMARHPPPLKLLTEKNFQMAGVPLYLYLR